MGWWWSYAAHRLSLPAIVVAVTVAVEARPFAPNISVMLRAAHTIPDTKPDGPHGMRCRGTRCGALVVRVILQWSNGFAPARRPTYLSIATAVLNHVPLLAVEWVTVG
jgi:hypothetical protein